MHFLKQLDRWIGVLLVRVVPRPSVAADATIRDLLVIRPGGIGDAALLAPLLLELKAAYPEAGIDLLAESRNGEVASMIPAIRQLFRYDRPVELFQVLRRPYDVVIDTEQWYHLSALVARLVRARLKVGFATNARGRMFNCPVTYRTEAYEADAFADLAVTAGLVRQVEVRAPFLTLPERIRAVIEPRLASLQGRPFVAIFPGGSFPGKCWPSESYSILAAELAAKGIPLVTLGGPEDIAVASVVAAAGRGLCLAGCLGLLESAAVVEQARVVVGNDSGLLHMAVGLNTPVLGLFGPSDSGKWGPRPDAGSSLQSSTPCSPCSLYGMVPACPTGYRCMGELLPDQVLEAVLALWKRASD